MPIDGSERVIIVTGMVHSGTTIAAHLLKQHPEVTVLADGAFSVFYETISLGAQSDKLRVALCATAKSILCKVIWSEFDSRWIRENCEGCRIVRCHKDLRSSITSWRKPTSLAGLEGMDDGQLARMYDSCEAEMLEAESFASSVFDLHNAELLADPCGTLASLCRVVGLSTWRFDISDIGRDKNIKGLLALEGGLGNELHRRLSYREDHLP